LPPEFLQGASMYDLVYIALGTIFTAVALVYAHACEAL
jgi:hypothetical protein